MPQSQLMFYEWTGWLQIEFFWLMIYLCWAMPEEAAHLFRENQWQKGAAWRKENCKFCLIFLCSSLLQLYPLLTAALLIPTLLLSFWLLASFLFLPLHPSLTVLRFCSHSHTVTLSCFCALGFGFFPPTFPPCLSLSLHLCASVVLSRAWDGWYGVC